MWRLKKSLIWAGGALFVVAALVGLTTLFLPHSPQIAGIYLTDGGWGMIEIRGSARKGLCAETDGLHPEMAADFSTLRDGVFRLEYSRLNPVQGWGTNWRLCTAYEFAPSSKTKRDWDVVAYGDERRSPSQITPADGDSTPVKTIRLTRPVHYLHRVDDSRISEYYRSLYPWIYRDSREKSSPRDRYKMAREILESHPNDLPIRSLYLREAVRNNDTREVTSRLEQWRAEFDGCEDYAVQNAIAHVELWLRERHLSAAGRNAFEFYQQVTTRTTDLASYLESLPKIHQYSEYAAAGHPLVSGANHLCIQVLANASSVLTVFWMLHGTRESCLPHLAAIYRLGQLMNESKIPIDYFIGVALRAMAVRSLSIVAMDGCQTKEELHLLLQTLNSLKSKSRSFDVARLLWSDYPFRIFFPLNLHGQNLAGNDFAEIRTPHERADAQFELVRMGAAAKHRLFSQGSFPTTDAQFNPLLPDGPPKDPFSDSPLRFLPNAQGLVCYSIGPDGTDEQASVEYDPTNGTLSRGDIRLQVPRQRQYPFPRQGVKAASIADLMRQFPNGLPPDPFASTRGKPLGTLLDQEGYVVVYSYGPDVDEFKRPGPHVLQCQYDPTNGTVSAGDIFLHLPKP